MNLLDTETLLHVLKRAGKPVDVIPWESGVRGPIKTLAFDAAKGVVVEHPDTLPFYPEHWLDARGEVLAGYLTSDGTVQVERLSPEDRALWEERVAETQPTFTVDAFLDWYGLLQGWEVPMDEGELDLLLPRHTVVLEVADQGRWQLFQNPLLEHALKAAALWVVGFAREHWRGLDPCSNGPWFQIFQQMEALLEAGDHQGVLKTACDTDDDLIWHSAALDGVALNVCGPPTREPVETPLRQALQGVDWNLLMTQRSLLSCVLHRPLMPEQHEAVEGVLELLHVLGVAAEKEGFPVVWQKSEGSAAH